ncbi:MAG TPA: carbamoyltransferase HypF [Lacipirellulaceae bacterium]
MTSISLSRGDAIHGQAAIAEPFSINSARRLILDGGVQGLGVRPAIFRLATDLGLGGSVRNSQRGVEIEIEGPEQLLEYFENSLSRALPSAAGLSQVESVPISPQGRALFAIVSELSEGPLVAHVPKDRALCAQCLREIGRQSDRRLNYPFTSCTLCGPRYTVIRKMPFERNDTAMDKFPLCADCLHEFRQPRDRRFHAQTMACPACGPHITSHEIARSNRLHGTQALKEAIRNIAGGRIVALRGLGGYQLIVDATNELAVGRLRDRKNRPAKPLAVLVKSVDVARRLAHFNEMELTAIEDASGPIVLVKAYAKNGLAAAIHPHLDAVGLMLPTTPLHAVLARYSGRPLVCTSANREGDPLEYKVEDADQHLSDLCDAWVEHDREIVRPIDDSVVRVIADRRVTIRLARGLAPLVLDLPPVPPAIAVGGYLKSAAAWSNGHQSVLGPHIGDQQSLPARQRFLDHLDDMQRLYRFRAELLIHDMHPEYFSSQWAQKQGIQTLAVQHHHAHVAAGMLEHSWLDRKVLGVAWDGTGYGTDGTIWGGEFLICSSTSFERVCRLRPFRLPGGEAAIHEPWRAALSICAQTDRSNNHKRLLAWNVDAQQLESVSKIIDRPQFSPLTSSAGRLIDAAAAIILGLDHADFDGQPAMRLESAADRDAKGWYEFPLSEGELPELDWRPLFTGLLADQRCGAEPSVIAMRFHRSLAHGILRVCKQWREMPTVLSGGVFQNKLLTELVAEMHDESQPLGLPGIIPPNDGGLAAGQLAIAAAKVGALRCV